VAAIDLTAFELPVLAPTEEEAAAHAALMADVNKASGGKAIWFSAVA
jgi:DNA polymerase-3 subunit epsilon